MKKQKQNHHYIQHPKSADTFKKISIHLALIHSTKNLYAHIIIKIDIVNCDKSIRPPLVVPFLHKTSQPKSHRD